MDVSFVVSPLGIEPSLRALST
ncbi:uncharacterized protein SOCEGT47_016370 [Sorangium cellulosum]|uniref:Uncharacterized protein n=1 Tax=Sorangium cellulosum TaxID=56 RepID=A0A4P2PXA8_SORCE|nr:uncharacterized protein SOCEGT47_016370 [Sorangium cellulosum]